VGFAQAVPVQRWDVELALGLSLWPWHRPFVVKQRLRRLAETAVLGDLPYTKEQTPGHRSWLVSALRDLGMHGRMVVEGPISSESPDHILRAEAAHRRDTWPGAEMAKVSAAFLVATLASDAVRLSVAEWAVAAFGVPTARIRADADLAPREAIPPAVLASPATLTPDGLYLFTPEDFTRSLSQGPAFVEILLEARHLARRFPWIPGQPPDLLEVALDRKPAPGEAEAMATQQGNKAELIARTGSPGRPSKSKQLYMAEHRRRLASGEAYEDVADEARHLLDVWLPAAWPTAERPTLATLQKAITSAHKQHFNQPRLRSAGRRTK
jgi:hypothetical protein